MSSLHDRRESRVSEWSQSDSTALQARELLGYEPDTRDPTFKRFLALKREEERAVKQAAKKSRKKQ